MFPLPLDRPPWPPARRLAAPAGLVWALATSACPAAPPPRAGSETLVALPSDTGDALTHGNQVLGGSGTPLPFSSRDIGALAANWTAEVLDHSDPFGVHVLVGLDASFCLDVPYGVPATGTVAHIYFCDLIPTAQTWTFEGGQLRIADKNGALWCLGLAGGTLNANAPVMSPCTAAGSPDPTQSWTWTGGMLRLAASDTCLALTADEPSPNLGLTTFACDPNNAVQQWRLAHIGSAPGGSDFLPIGLRANALSDPTLCLDLNRGQVEQGVVQGYACNLSGAQRWVFEGGRISTQNTACLAADPETGAVTTTACLGGSRLQAWEVVGGLLRLRGTTLCLCLPAPGSAGGGAGPVGPATLANCPTQPDDQRNCRWLLGQPHG